MAEIVQSLFGITPESYQQAQQDRINAQALQYAKLDPFEQANYAIGRGANILAGALGGEDPQLKMVSMRQQIARQINPNSPESIQQGIAALQQAGDAQGAFMLQDEYRKMQESGALVGQRNAAQQSSLATAAKTQLTIDQETKLRDELSKLGPNATEADIRGVMVKYGDPDKVLAALTSAATREADREARVDAARLANEARVDAAKVAAEARLQAAREAGATRLQIAQLQAENRRDLAALTSSLKGPKTLPATLQKEEDKDLDMIDSLTTRVDTLKPAIASLTPDPATKVPFLQLGPVANTRYQVQNASGNSTPESRAYANLQRAVQEATNLKTDAAKGVQTDRDVLRFANELTAAFGKFDTKTTLEALTNFSNATDKAAQNTKKRLDARRKSQGIEPYGGQQLGTAQNPIKLD
jgi:hypothetical protein